MAAIKFRVRMPSGPSRLIWSVCLATTVALVVMIIVIQNEDKTMEFEAVTLPEAMAAREDHYQYDLVVNVMRDGTIRVMGRTCTVERLYALLARERARRVAAARREPLVKIRCDYAAPYGHVLAVIASCQRAGIYEVSFGVAEKYIPYELEKEG